MFRSHFLIFGVHQGISATHPPYLEDYTHLIEAGSCLLQKYSPNFTHQYFSAQPQRLGRYVRTDTSAQVTQHRGPGQQGPNPTRQNPLGLKTCFLTHLPICITFYPHTLPSMGWVGGGGLKNQKMVSMGFQNGLVLSYHGSCLNDQYSDIIFFNYGGQGGMARPYRGNMCGWVGGREGGWLSNLNTISTTPIQVLYKHFGAYIILERFLS